ncbi:MAG: DUF6584 family protein [Pirellulales bacterium]
MTKRTARNKAELTAMVESDLAVVERHLAAGQLEQARQAMATIQLNCRPAIYDPRHFNAVLAKRVGAAWHVLGYEAMAGYYWYWVDDESPEVVAARREFERSCGDLPLRVFELIGLNPNLVPKDNPRIAAMATMVAEYRAANRSRIMTKSPGDRIALVGCAVVASAIVFVLALGIGALIGLFRPQ